MFCSQCGKMIGDNCKFCPACGAPVQRFAGGTPGQNGNPAVYAGGQRPQYVQNVATVQASRYPDKNRNGWGIAGLIFSLLSIFTNMFYCVAGILGFLFSVIGCARRKHYRKSNGCAVAGLVLSLIFTVGWAIILMVGFTVVLAAIGLA